MNQGAIITDLATHVPEAVLTNAMLAEETGKWSAEQIFEKTGVRERHIAAEGELASDLAAHAAQKLFDNGVVSPEEIDFLIFCTQAPDYILPTTACLLQQRLGLRRSCGAFDVNLGCSGFVYCLSLAKGLIESGQAGCILLLTGDTYSKFIHPKDASVRTLFGDGAAATLIRAGERGIGEFIFGTDGRGGRHLTVPAGGLRSPSTPETCVEVEDADGNVRSQENLYMNGREIFRFAITSVPKVVKGLFEKTGWSTEEIDYLVLHQGSRIMLDELVRKLKMPQEKVPYAFETIGNTVSSTIPFVLEDLVRNDRLRSGHRLFLVGFGVGYSWAGASLTWA